MSYSTSNRTQAVVEAAQRVPVQAPKPLALLCPDPACERCAAVREELEFSGDLL